MEFKDYYKILGVERDASQEDIKRAFRRLAREHHPDTHRGSEEKFKEINEAYEVLRDPEKRKQYDLLGRDWDQRSREPGFGQVHFTWGGAEDGFSDFFRAFFGGQGAGFEGRSGAAAWGGVGRDVEATLEISLEDAYHGTTRQFRLEEGGRSRLVDVKVPAGVRDGTRLRLAGQGARGLGGQVGDLLLRIHIHPHHRFHRKGDDLETEVQVPVTTAVLGGDIQVPTMQGNVAMKVPPETQDGRVFRLRGMGMPRLGGGSGDQLVRVRISVPRNLSERERQLYRELAQLRSGGGGS